jgi:hypothetical protein
MALRFSEHLSEAPLPRNGVDRLAAECRELTKANRRCSEYRGDLPVTRCGSDDVDREGANYLENALLRERLKDASCGCHMHCAQGYTPERARHGLRRERSARY